eukprot:1157339-Pelagomonas_calceolata.AAC.11
MMSFHPGTHVQRKEAHKLTSARRAIGEKDTHNNFGALGLQAARNPSDPHRFPSHPLNSCCNAATKAALLLRHFTWPAELQSNPVACPCVETFDGSPAILSYPILVSRPSMAVQLWQESWPFFLCFL